MIRRYGLTDKQFAEIENLLPKPGRRRGRWNDHRVTLNGIFWWLHTGAQWREVPERYGKVAGHLRPLQLLAQGRHARPHPGAPQRRRTPRSGALERGRHEQLRQPLSGRSEKGKKQAYDPADQALGRSRGGFGSKVHLIVDGHGGPLAATVTAGEAHESKHAASTLEQVRLPNGRGRPSCRPKRLAGNKAYSYPAVRAYLRRRGILPVSPRTKINSATRSLTRPPTKSAT